MMQQFEAGVVWERGAQPFVDNRYSRVHEWLFGGGVRVPASSSPLSVALPMSAEAAVDPEEALVAAVSSCHMLFFLALARQAGFVVDSYRDNALGTLENNAAGKKAMTRIALRPTIAWSGAAPDRAQLGALHHAAHEQCYIANSITAVITIEGAD